MGNGRWIIVASGQLGPRLGPRAAGMDGGVRAETGAETGGFDQHLRTARKRTARPWGVSSRTGKACGPWMGGEWSRRDEKL